MKYTSRTDHGHPAAAFMLEFRVEPADVVAVVARFLAHLDTVDHARAADKLDATDVVLMVTDTLRDYGKLGEGWRCHPWRHRFDEAGAERVWETARARMTVVDPRNAEAYRELVWR